MWFISLLLVGVSLVLGFLYVVFHKFSLASIICPCFFEGFSRFLWFHKHIGLIQYVDHRHHHLNHSDQDQRCSALHPRGAASDVRNLREGEERNIAHRILTCRNNIHHD